MRGKQRPLVILTPIVAIALALLVGAVIIAALGKDPVRGYFMLFYGSLGSPQKIAQSLVTACPLIFTSLAAAFAYKCGVYNLGGEGQFIMGAGLLRAHGRRGRCGNARRARRGRGRRRRVGSASRRNEDLPWTQRDDHLHHA